MEVVGNAVNQVDRYEEGCQDEGREVQGIMEEEDESASEKTSTKRMDWIRNP